MSPQRACIFCGKSGSLTREDIVAEWIGGVLSDMQPGAEWRTHETAGGAVTIDRNYPAGGPVIVLKWVCGTCNNGWMSDIEGSAKGVLEPMIRGHRVRLEIDHQVDVASWASKTFLALEHREPSFVVGRQEDRDLVRTEQRPPTHHKVRIAYRSRYLEAIVSRLLIGTSDGTAHGPADSFAWTICIGHAIVQVWGGHGADTGPGLTRVGTKVGRAVMVWPPVPHAVDWPPVEEVTDEGFDLFANEVIPLAGDTPSLSRWREERHNQAD